MWKERKKGAGGLKRRGEREKGNWGWIEADALDKNEGAGRKRSEERFIESPGKR